MPTLALYDETALGEKTARGTLELTATRTTAREVIRETIRREAPADWESRFARAVEAFEHNGIILLVADRQIEDLDEPIEIAPETDVTFLKLVPLVGG